MLLNDKDANSLVGCLPNSNVQATHDNRSKAERQFRFQKLHIRFRLETAQDNADLVSTLRHY